MADADLNARTKTALTWCAPGEDLRVAILMAGRPTYPVLDGLAVPRLEHVPMCYAMSSRADDERRTALVRPAELNGRFPLLDQETRRALLTPSEETVRLAVEKSHARGQLRFLAAAALRDVAGLDLLDVGRELGYVIKDKRGRAVRHVTGRAADKGADLWRSLAAWPWWGLPAGPLPEAWWELLDVIERFEVWRTAARQWPPQPRPGFTMLERKQYEARAAREAGQAKTDIGRRFGRALESPRSAYVLMTPGQPDTASWHDTVEDALANGDRLPADARTIITAQGFRATYRSS